MCSQHKISKIIIIFIIITMFIIIIKLMTLCYYSFKYHYRNQHYHIFPEYVKIVIIDRSRLKYRETSKRVKNEDFFSSRKKYLLLLYTKFPLSNEASGENFAPFTLLRECRKASLINWGLRGNISI